MQRMFQLTAWNWHMARRGVAAVGLLLTACELALLAWRAFDVEFALYTYNSLFVVAHLPDAFAVGYLAVLAASLYPLLLAQGRARAGYTMLTLPMPRWQLLAAQVLTSILALLALMAWQVLLTVLCYGPVTAIQARAALLGTPLRQAGRFWWSLAGNPLLRMLLPTDLVSVGFVLAYLAAPAILGAGVLLHRGWRRITAIVMLLVGAVCCYALVGAQLLHIAQSGEQASEALRWGAGPLGIVLLLAWLWDLRALHRAELTR